MADFEELKNELIKSYQDLLELQYHEKPKAREHIKTICESLIADMVLWKIQEQCMDVDISIGVQLDIIGKWVGIDRYFKENKYENNKWYAYYDWEEKDQPNSLQGGMWDWDTSEKPNNAPFLNYDWILVIKNKLKDDDFRTLIKLKIIKNNTNATCKNIDDEIYKLFKGVIYTIWGEKLFDKSKFTVVGSPTVTDDGIASGFSNNDYINLDTAILDTSRPWVITINYHSAKRGVSIERVISLASPDVGLVIAPSINGFSFRTKNINISIPSSYKQDTNYQLAFGWDMSQYFLIVDGIKKTKKSTEVLTPSFLELGYMQGKLATEAAKGSIDLKSFSITVDGKEVFSGVKDKVMELTYKYPENQTSIMNLAKTKNCLPCPSGVRLKMEGIPDNE
nr:MAG TPA: Protein of unknown function (DUF2612) [Caudoviricetes sp.]